MVKQQLFELSNNRFEAEKLLKQAFGFNNFYDEQWRAIQCLLRGERILLIERTGFGKSLCYQFPAILFDGLTIVFSPLVALMRDQVNSLNQKGINARCINYEQSKEENEEAIKLALTGKLKILYIAPERQENTEWLESVKEMKLSMVVIDEAHTISVWGHDFRPAFKRIINLVKLLPIDTPVLATTATATLRTQKDIEAQMGTGVKTIRGNLLRENFKLYVIETNSEDEKLIWIAKYVNKLSGNGLIYTGTRVDAEVYSRWLEFVGVNAIGYHAGLDSDSRKEIEKGLMDNKYKCIVSTNALGMGIDKSDIRFIIHTQIPQSPIHYYQEIGRAGRDGLTSHLILFFNSQLDSNNDYIDSELPKAFIETAKPNIETYQKVIDILKEEMLRESDILRKANIKQQIFRVIKADLIEQGIIKEMQLGRSKYYMYQPNAPELDTTKFEELKQFKLDEFNSMIDYVFTKQARMKFLCNYLGDEFSDNIKSGCDNTSEKKLTPIEDYQLREKLKEFHETYFPTIKCVQRYNNIIDGVAASFYGVSNVGATIHRCKYENGGDFPDFLVRQTLRAYRKKIGNKHIDFVMFVPPSISGTLVENFAKKIAQILDIPFSYAVEKTKETEPQKIFRNSYLKRDNVKDSFSINNTNVKDKTILLIDDIYDSGATLREIGKILTKAGALEIVPLVIAKTVGRDND